jgi:hypothetical protein
MSAPCAYAQSSVTLVGIIDAGITYFSNLNGHGTFVANDGSIQSNRWGCQAAKILAAVSGGAAPVFLGGGPAPRIFQRAICRIGRFVDGNPDRHAHKVLKPMP